VKQQAIIDEMSKRVMWPERMSYDHLAYVRESNYSGFMKIYQTTIVGNEVAKISQDKIEACFDASRKMLPNGISADERKKYKYILQGVDPAWTKNKRSKYAVILTVGITHDDERVVLDIFREKVDYDGLFGWIKAKYYALLPQWVIVESNQMQSRLAQEVQNASIPTRAIFTSGEKNNPDIGVPMLYSLITSGKLRLPAGDEVSKQLSNQLINEILSYPHGEYSDILMALYFVEQEVRKRFVTVKTVMESAVTGRKVDGSRFSRRYTSVWH
jgi:phage terminase large subunit-like protein